MATAEQTMMKVQRILTGPMGLTVQLEGNAMSVQFSDASTKLRITVVDWGTTEDGEPQSLVRVTSPILWGVEPSAELYEWIAREGGDFLFGHVLALDDSDDPGKLFLLMTQRSWGTTWTRASSWRRCGGYSGRRTNSMTSCRPGSAASAGPTYRSTDDPQPDLGRGHLGGEGVRP